MTCRRNSGRARGGFVRANGRTRTIAVLIDKLTRAHGRPPSDVELAKLLAINVARVRFHREMLGR